ncbi:MAG: alpha/beta fold hydrolase [Sphingomicrobium sp.]
MTEPDIAFITAGGQRLAYRRRNGTSPSLLFLPGYASDMAGAKATAIDAFAAEQGVGLVRFDYSGTGKSGGDFADGTLERWIDEALAVVDKVTEGPLILIGSSMGGWIALHVALARPKRVAGLVGIAAAPDFTQWGFTESQMRQIAREGMIEEANPYGPEPSRFYRDFWQSGQSLRLLEGEIAVDCPVRLVHGDQDEEVPAEVAQRLLARLRSADVQLLTIKDGGHRLSQPREIDAILRTIGGLLELNH